VIPDGSTAEEYFGVTNGFFDGNVGDLAPEVHTIAQTIVAKMVREVNTLVDPATGLPDPNAVDNVITAEVVALANTLLGNLPIDDEATQNHVCQSTLGDGRTQDCTGSDRVKTIVKAMCTAVLSSAVVTHQ
jgi:hypothetical protein